MEDISVALTVYFDGQYWIAKAEKNIDGQITIAKYLFLKEPKDSEIYSFFINGSSRFFVNFIQPSGALKMCYP